MSERTPIIRYFTLPNGDKIMSLRESTLRAGLKAAAAALRATKCPFDGPHDFAPTDPCPVCGDLGALVPDGEDEPESRCVTPVRA